MRKLILVLVIVLALALSGCGNDDRVTRQSLCSDSGGSWYVSAMSDEKICIYDNYYTQEEIDEMWEQLETYLEDDSFGYINNLNERVLELESELRDFERFEYEDLVELMYYFDEEFGDEMQHYVIDRIDELEQRIEELESVPLDIVITHGTMNGVIAYGDDGYIIVTIGDMDYECISMYEGSFFWYEDLTVVIINDIYYTYPTRIN